MDDGAVIFKGSVPRRVLVGAYRALVREYRQISFSIIARVGEGAGTAQSMMRAG